MVAVNVAILNDYPVVVMGLDAMLGPYGERIQVIDMQTGDRDSDTPVDVTLYDTFGRPLGSNRVQELLDDPSAGQVLVYSWGLSPDLLAGAMGVETRSQAVRWGMEQQMLPSDLER